MAKRIPPSSWNRDPAKAPGRGRRARADRDRTTCQPATPDPVFDENDLIRTLQQRLPERNTTGFGLSDFIYALGSPVDALLYSVLFWPELLEIDGAILASDAIADEADLERVRTSVRELGPLETEKRFNLREFSDLFGNGLAEIGDDQTEVLLARLAQMWRCRLASRFPARRFVVEIWPADETGGDIGIVFHQAAET